MIGPPAGFQPLLDFAGRYAAAIDRLAAGRHPRDHAEAGRDAGRAVIERPRQGALEHAGIEFVGFAVGVDVGARKTRRQEGHPEHRSGAEQLVDEGILGAPQRGQRNGGLTRKAAG